MCAWHVKRHWVQLDAHFGNEYSKKKLIVCAALSDKATRPPKQE